MRHLVKIPDAVIRRLPQYLRYCEKSVDDGRYYVRSSELANDLGTTSSLVRQDLSYFGDFGDRGVGYSSRELKRALSSVLGIDTRKKAIIVGMGSCGNLMLDYLSRENSFVHPVALFDIDPALVGRATGGLKVADAAEIEGYLAENLVDICIISTSDASAAQAARLVARCGIKAIINLTNAYIPPVYGVFNENLRIHDSLLRVNFFLNNGV